MYGFGHLVFTVYDRLFGGFPAKNNVCRWPIQKYLN
jgi:hypothetical protein